MTDIDTLKRAALIIGELHDAYPREGYAALSTAIESLAERMGQEPVAWEHTFRKIGGGRTYSQADYSEPPMHPAPDPGYEWVRASPLYVAPQPTPEDRLTQALTERDELEERATALAEAVGEYVGVDVGEWSSANDPIAAAMEAIEMREQERVRMVDRAHLRLRASMERVDELPVHPTPQPTPEDVRDAEKSSFDVELVQCYLYALLDEARRRGSMFPQTSDEQDADADAIHRVCGMARWYADRGEPTASAIEKLRLIRAAMQQEQAK